MSVSVTFLVFSSQIHHAILVSMPKTKYEKQTLNFVMFNVVIFELI